MRPGTKLALAYWGAAAVIAAAGIAAVLVRRTRQPPREEAVARASWRCQCGQDYVVAGQDRHRIYWLTGAGDGDPVLAGRCPNCDRALPVH